MRSLTISPDFTVEDIHKIRAYNYEATKSMSFEDRKSYYAEKAETFKKRLTKEKHGNGKANAHEND